MSLGSRRTVCDCADVFVMNAYAVYFSPARITSGCTKLIWNRGSLTTIVVASLPVSDTSAWGGFLYVAWTVTLTVCVPALSASRLQSRSEEHTSELQSHSF